MKDAWEDLQKHLKEGEIVEAIVFGNWGWEDYGQTRIFVPEDKRGIVMTTEEARHLMKGWSFDGMFGSPKCYAVWIWTNESIFWVTQYNGKTWLSSAPRNPTAGIPEMTGV